MSASWPKHDMSFLGGLRQRRLRRTGWMRDMLRETVLTPYDFIWPLFIIEGQNERTQIRTMPGVERLSIDLAVEAARAAAAQTARRRASPGRAGRTGRRRPRAGAAPRPRPTRCELVIEVSL